MKIKNIAILTLLSLTAPSFCAKNKVQKPISSYTFAQQMNAICLMVPVMNLEILEQLQKNKYDLTKLPTYTRAEWFGILNPFEVSWFKPFANLNIALSNDPNFNDYAALKTYIDEGAAHGPVLPYFYNKNGKFPFGGFLKGTDEAIRLFSLPFMLIDLNGAENFKLKIFFNLLDVTKQFDIREFRPYLYLPVVQTEDDIKNNKLRVFNQSTKKYDLVDEKKYLVLTQIDDGKEYKIFNISNRMKMLQKYSKNGTVFIPDLENFNMAKRTDKLFQTYSSVGIYHPPLGQAYTNGTSEYVPYMQGIYKMILLTLGVNHDNNVLAVDGKATNIIDTYGERDVMIGLQNLCNADDNHPWNKKRFNKEMFLPYAIADLLKKNPSLANQLKQTIDIGFHDWEEYEKLVSGFYYNKNKEQMTGKNVAQYIPGEQQALAYMLMHNIRFLWYGSQNPKAFYSETIPQIPLLWTFDNFAKKAAQKKTIKNGVDKTASFLDTWILIRNAIIKNYKRNSWMSFEGHGWVISFDPEIIKLERSKSGSFYNDELNKLLGIAGIESFLTSELKMFYKGTKKEEVSEEKEETTSEDKEEQKSKTDSDGDNKEEISEI